MLIAPCRRSDVLPIAIDQGHTLPRHDPTDHMHRESGGEQPGQLRRWQRERQDIIIAPAKRRVPSRFQPEKRRERG